MTLIHFSKLNELPPIKLSESPISAEFSNKNITSFQQACDYIQKLPYGRHLKRDDFLAILIDGKGSCTVLGYVLYTSDSVPISTTQETSSGYAEIITYDITDGLQNNIKVCI